MQCHKIVLYAVLPGIYQHLSPGDGVGGRGEGSRVGCAAEGDGAALVIGKACAGHQGAVEARAARVVAHDAVDRPNFFAQRIDARMCLEQPARHHEIIAIEIFIVRQ